MKRYKNKIILTIITIGLFTLAGCDNIKFNTFNGSDEDTEIKVTQVAEEVSVQNDTNLEDDNSDNITPATVAPVTTSSEDTTKKAMTPTPAPIQPSANIELTIYTINADGDVEPITALVSEDTEITPLIIVDKVLESLADQSIIIGVKNVSTNNKNVIVNFETDKTPGSNMGSSFEAAILDAIAQSLIDNLDQYSGVIYRINDEAYASGAFELGIDDIYLGNN